MKKQIAFLLLANLYVFNCNAGGELGLDLTPQHFHNILTEAQKQALTDNNLGYVIPGCITTKGNPEERTISFDIVSTEGELKTTKSYQFYPDGTVDLEDTIKNTSDNN